ncbi:MAG: GNAT family N-acetyltransferase [bacterium]|nr:GNAT family N-acetyltransferase [bacterium]
MHLELAGLDILKKLQIDKKDNEDIYLFKDNKEKIVGLSKIITLNEDNYLEFLIIEKYQNKGYGKILLEITLNILKNNGFHEVYLDINKKNYKAISIISHFNGELLSTVGNQSKYIIFI